MQNVILQEQNRKFVRNLSQVLVGGGFDLLWIQSFPFDVKVVRICRITLVDMMVYKLLEVRDIGFKIVHTFASFGLY